MYAAFDDPYCYPGSSVLKNKLGIRDVARLSAFEDEIARERAAEPLPNGRLGVSHFRAVHRHLFQDVSRWAGHLRTVRIARGGSIFCYPEYIAGELDRVFAQLKRDNFLRGRDAADFAIGATRFLSKINAIHAFRDGNGRAQLGFMTLLAARADHPLDMDKLEPEAFLTAMISSFQGDARALTVCIRQLLANA